MKSTLLLTLLLLTVSCGKDSLKVIHNNDRVSELERRADLNDQLNSIQSALIEANSQAIAAEQSAREAKDLLQDQALNAEIQIRALSDLFLGGLLAAERQARINGDAAQANALANEIAARIEGDDDNSRDLRIAVIAQSINNLLTQGQIASINFKINQLKSRMNSAESALNSLDARLDAVEGQVSDLQSDLASLSLSINARVDLVSAVANAAQAQVDQQGVRVFKCNSNVSTERILKINGKFYAAMNRVTKGSIPVLTEALAQTITIPNLCKNSGGKLKLPNSSGACTGGGWSLMPGSSTTVQAYTTSQVSVVTDVKIALDILSNGSYSTTDGGAACTFSINNDSSTNLIAVQ